MRTTLRHSTKALPGHARVTNRALVLQRLFHDGPLSRADLARLTGLTRVTVSDLVGSLLDEGIVADLGLRAESRVGKPATLVGLRTEAFQVVGVDLADDALMHGAVLDLAGAVLTRRSAPLDGRTGEAAVGALVDFCGELVAAATEPLLGIGIGSPGVVDAEGRVVEAPNRHWFHVPLADTVAAALDLPVHVANDANTACLGEYTYGGGGASGGLLVVTVGEGVGAGIVIDGALVAGDRHAAGEIGHVTAVDDRDERPAGPRDPGVVGPPQRCACGRLGCLETVLAVPALRRRVAGLDGTERAAALAAVGRRLGIVLAPVVSALNLSEVVLSGPPELLDGPLRDAALATLRERTMPVISDGLELRLTSLGEDGALSGAAVLVLSGQLGVT
nr:ROK family transcriptional regulator [uncultured Actinotalea sp.]